MITATFTNTEAGMEASVHQIGAARFSVTLKDLDSDNVLPSVIIYSDLDKATTKAKEVLLG